MRIEMAEFETVEDGRVPSVSAGEVVKKGELK